MDTDEIEKILQNQEQELKRGALVLSVLLMTATETYGYSLVQDLQNAGIEVEQNTLYPLLRRLENQGLLQSTWNTEESRPRKYYMITEDGKGIRNQLITRWKQINMSVTSLIQEVEG